MYWLPVSYTHLDVYKRQVYIDVDDQCRLNMDQLKEAVNDETVLISVMAVNNEVGTIMPLSDVAAAKGRALFHADAVQGYGKVDLHNTGADLISLSSHKIHGPKGVGALYIRKGVNLPAFMVGGGQEKHRRSGTENAVSYTHLIQFFKEILSSWFPLVGKR